MRYRVIAPGLYGAKGEMAVGSEITLNGELNPEVSSRLLPLADQPDPEGVPVTNPAKEGDQAETEGTEETAAKRGRKPKGEAK